MDVVSEYNITLLKQIIQNQREICSLLISNYGKEHPLTNIALEKLNEQLMLLYKIENIGV